MADNDFHHIPYAEGEKIAHAILTGAGFSAPYVQVMSRNMLEAQQQECHSHGLYRLISCAMAARNGAVDPVAEPLVTDHARAIVKTDARGGCSLLAFERSIDLLSQKASVGGMAALAINHCFHYSALWWEVEQLSQRGLVALAMNPTHPYVSPFGGRTPLLGTNPLAFSWPRPGHAPYTFDFATSAAARGEIELRARNGTDLPADWAIDAEGQPTTDSSQALKGALLTFGGHKGSAISTMIELMAGPMIGDLLSSETAQAGTDASRGIGHGELILVFDPAAFGANLEQADTLFAGIIEQGARLPSQRRRDAGKRARTDGLLVAGDLLIKLKEIVER